MRRSAAGGPGYDEAGYSAYDEADVPAYAEASSSAPQRGRRRERPLPDFFAKSDCH